MMSGLAMVADSLVMNPRMAWNVRGFRAAGHRSDRALVGAALHVALQGRRFLHAFLMQER
jgi:hypothetical protein